MTLIFGAGTVTFAQKTEGKKSTPPAVTKAALLKAFPDATSVKWEKEDASCEAKFKSNGKEMLANFDNNGTMLESEIPLKISELPASASEYIKTHYKVPKLLRLQR